MSSLWAAAPSPFLWLCLCCELLQVELSSSPHSKFTTWPRVGTAPKNPAQFKTAKKKVITPIPSISCVRTLEGPGTGLSPRLSGLSVALWCQQNMSCKCWFLGSKHKQVNRLAACKVCLNDSCSVFLNFSKQRSLKCSGAKSVSFLIQRKFCGVGALTEVGVEAQWQNRNQK